MNMIIPFIALFLPAVTLGETKSIKLHMFYQEFPTWYTNVKGKKRKRNKEYNQTTSVFYIR